MDQIKVGKFIAELRRRNGLTQEALDEKIGVTNKTVSHDSAFSYNEKLAFWKRKWLKEHIALIILWVAVFIAFCAYVYVKRYIIIISLTPLIGGSIYAYLRNKMMAYIERNIY